MVYRINLCRKDLTLHHCVVSSTSVGRARVINWKSVCIVLCCCFRYVEKYTKERVSRTVLIFCFHLMKLLPYHTDYFEKFIVNMVLRKIPVNDGFGVSKMVTSTEDKKNYKKQGKPPKISKM